MSEGSKKKLITIREVAELLGVSSAAIYGWLRAGVFPPGVIVKIGGRRVYFNREKLLEWIDKGGILSKEA